MASFAIVPGEEELGVQAFCPRCKAWWPMGADFWSGEKNAPRRCRACASEVNRAEHVTKMARLTPEERRARWQAQRRRRAA